jgi:fused signal recognition particle receptor
VNSLDAFNLQNINPTEVWTLGIGSVGLVMALVFIALRSSRRRRLRGRPELTPPAPTQAETPSVVTPAPEPVAPAAQPQAAAPQPIPTPTPPPAPAKNRWWGALAKSRSRFVLRFNGDVRELRESLEEACLGSDLGVQNTEEALSTLAWPEIAALPESQRLEGSKERLAHVLEQWIIPADGADPAWPARHNPDEPTVIWFVGVNGTGKTTSISKLALELKQRGHAVLLAAGDTFRAAAGEQLETWAQRLDIPCVRGQEGSDSSSVLFDALQAGKARKVDFILCDSAGRLHNQSQLMDALAKNKRVMDKALPGAPHEVLLVLDANTGQNMVNQAEMFRAAVGVTGLVLTKLDGTARGGAVVAVARKTGLPIRRLGLGESPEDFVRFEARPFAAALLGTERA